MLCMCGATEHSTSLIHYLRMYCHLLSDLNDFGTDTELLMTDSRVYSDVYVSCLHCFTCRAGVRGDRAVRPHRVPKFAGRGWLETKVKQMIFFLLLAVLALKSTCLTNDLFPQTLFIYSWTLFRAGTRGGGAIKGVARGTWNIRKYGAVTFGFSTREIISQTVVCSLDTRPQEGSPVLS